MTLIRIVATCFLLLLAAMITAQDTLWTKQWGGAGLEQINTLEPTMDGGFIGIGFTDSFGNGRLDVWLLKFNSDGDTAWTRTFGSTGVDYGGSVKQTPDGGFILVGTYDQARYSGGIILVKVDSLGVTQWETTYRPDDFPYYVYSSVSLTADGGYMVGGFEEISDLSFSASLLRFDSLGSVDSLHNPIPSYTTTWSSARGMNSQSTLDGGFLICGWTEWAAAGAVEMLLSRTDANLDILWSKTYGDGTSTPQGAYSVQETSDGGIIVIGYTGHPALEQANLWLLKTNSNGDSLWSRSYGLAVNSSGYCVRQTADQGFIIAGKTADSTTVRTGDGLLLKTNASGDSLWSLTVGGPALNYFTSVVPLDNDTYMLAGAVDVTFPGLTGNAWLVKVGGFAATCCSHPGDTNHNGGIDVSDLTYFVSYLFEGGTAPVCPDEGDINGDGSIDIADLTFIVAYLFGGGIAPPPC